MTKNGTFHFVHRRSILSMPGTDRQNFPSISQQSGCRYDEQIVYVRGHFRHFGTWQLEEANSKAVKQPGGERRQRIRYLLILK